MVLDAIAYVPYPGLVGSEDWKTLGVAEIAGVG